MKTKYIWLLLVFIGFTACEDDDNSTNTTEPTVDLTAGEADFSNYVALGNSLTAGFTDNALFVAAQENSMPNLLSQKFALAGGGAFTQPLMEGNTGGMIIPIPGVDDLPYRLIFNGSGPQPLNEFLDDQGFPVPPVMTNAAVNLMSNFNNCGVPGAKASHLLFDGYAALNPYFGRMASAPNATILGDAMAQNPTFFSLWIGNNDVLGYATSGGDGTDPITPLAGPPGVGFEQTYGALIQSLTANGAKGIVANIPDVTTIPHFTTVPHNPLDPSNPDFGPQIPVLNATFASLNAAFDFMGMPERKIEFSETAASSVVIHDESLPNVAATLSSVLQGGGLDPLTAGLLANQYGQSRQANENDLIVLPASSAIATVDTNYYAFLVGNGVPATTAGQLSVIGVTLPMADKWVLLPSEQDEIAQATTAFNDIIFTAAQNAGLAFVDANELMTNLANGGVQDGDFILTDALVQGGAFSLDGVHPTARGYALLANKFMKVIDETYGSTFEASGNLYDIGEYPTNYSPMLQ